MSTRTDEGTAMTTTAERTTLHDTATELVGGARGILAADESVGTMSKRLEGAGVEPTEENRRAYREMLITTANVHEGISGVILADETFHQKLSDGRPFPQAVTELGMVPGIKVDTGAKPLAGAPGEKVTEGLDGLPDRLAEYVEMGACFAKWRAVFTIGDGTPSDWALSANAHALARYAIACQEAGLVPIVEPEVLMDGDHSQQRGAEVTAATLQMLFGALAEAGVDPRGTVLKPNMVLPGQDSGETCDPEQVARVTVDTLRRSVPDELAGIAFLSGGQSSEDATANLAALRAVDTPWPMSFSFGRALVSPPLTAWSGDPDRFADGQAALAEQVAKNSEVLRGHPAPNLRIA